MVCVCVLLLLLLRVGTKCPETYAFKQFGQNTGGFAMPPNEQHPCCVLIQAMKQSAIVIV